MKKRHKINWKKLIIWLVAIAIVLGLYIIHKEWFSILFLKDYVEEYKLLVVIAYIFVLSILGLFFIPSTPFAMAGILLFSPTEAYIFNLIGILTSSTIVYHFARYLGLDVIFERKYPKKIKKVKEALRHKELPIIAGWSFFPLVPTDLIIYISSGFRIKLWKCLLGVLLGEGTLNAVYLFSAYQLLAI